MLLLTLVAVLLGYLVFAYLVVFAPHNIEEGLWGVTTSSNNIGAHPATSTAQNWSLLNWAVLGSVIGTLISPFRGTPRPSSALETFAYAQVFAVFFFLMGKIL